VSVSVGDGAGLADELRAAPSVAAACAKVVDHLVAAGVALSSLYLERGGRMRCQAVRGYWQVFDGMPTSAGVIGATFRSGLPVQIRGVSVRSDYLAAAPEVVDEVCVPIVAADQVVGVLNVESTTGLPSDALRLVTDAAGLFAARLVELGGVPAESPAQRLARHALLLNDTEDPEQLPAAACAAAREVTGASSAAVVLGHADGSYRVSHAAGPVALTIAESAPGEVLEAVAGWVASGSSCWSSGDPEGTSFPGGQVLREAGAATVLVVPLGAGGPVAGGPGFLLVADERRLDQAADTVELLELLAAHTTSCARTLASLAALRRQASQDPLTGLGHHAAYRSALTAALGSGPVGRGVAVLMLDLDGFKAVNDEHGHPAGDALLVETARVLSGVLRPGEAFYRVGGDEFAAVIQVATAAEAQAVGSRVQGAVRTGLGRTVSVGVALAVPGEAPEELTARADRALYDVKRAGRDGVRLAVPPRPAPEAD